jgi:hypothetical protein
MNDNSFDDTGQVVEDTQNGYAMIIFAGERAGLGMA